MAGKVRKTPSYEVKITLLDLAPPVWRRLVLPGQWHLGTVHTALQVAMGWEDCHLHEFEVDGVRYGEPDPVGMGAPVRRETAVRLHEALPQVGSTIVYTYDFGDGWEHELLVEAVGEPTQQAVCLAGERACPPEDSGGPWGYADMLAAVADPKHPDREHFAEWLGEDFDPEAFDPEPVNRDLPRIG